MRKHEGALQKGEKQRKQAGLNEKRDKGEEKGEREDEGGAFNVLNI